MLFHRAGSESIVNQRVMLYHVYQSVCTVDMISHDDDFYAVVRDRGARGRRRTIPRLVTLARLCLRRVQVYNMY